MKAMPQPDVAIRPTSSNTIGSRSTLFLVLAYRVRSKGPAAFSLDDFEASLEKTGRWRRKSIDDGGLLPHLDVQVEDGLIIRAFEARGDLANMFDPRSLWHFQKPPRRPGKTAESKSAGPGGPISHPAEAPSVVVKISGAPMLYVLKTGYVFMVVGVRPTGGAKTATNADARATLRDFQDTYACIVRRGWNHLTADRLPQKKGSVTGEIKPHPLALLAQSKGLADTSLRSWLALLVPGLDPAPPQGGRKSPMAIGALFVRQPLSKAAQYRIRLAHDTDQIDPPPEDQDLDAAAAWHPSANEQCLFSPLGVTWIVHQLEPDGFLGRFDETLRARYIYKWILVEHQRLFLTWLSAMCAKMSDNPDARTFRWLRLELLGYTAIYDFGHISSEERHDKFYRALRRALDIDGLFTEVKEEIKEINDHLSAERAAVLNEILAFLTLVLTPVGLVIGIYQRETLPPEAFHPRMLITADAWLALVTHWPFWFVVLSAITGAFVFTRVLGASAVRRLLERIRHGGAGGSVGKGGMRG